LLNQADRIRLYLLIIEMKNLWSPWRSKYIESFKDGQSQGNCIFCEAIDKDIFDMSNLVVRKKENTLIVMNLYPYNNGHLLIVPKRHLGSIEELSADESHEMMDEIILAEKVLQKIYSPQGFNIGANLGRAGGAGIADHIHFHIVPRWNGDSNFMPVIGEVKVISQDLADTKKKLLSGYKELS
jgi:ATP adenylyltransferase